MKKGSIAAVIAAVVIIALFGLMMYMQSQQSNDSQGNNQDTPNTNDEQEVMIQESFATKVVYTTDASVDAEVYRNDCVERGGIFNECGTICEPGATVCASVCAFTCEEIGRVQGAEQTGTQTDAVLDDRIRVSTPDPGSMIFAPLTISGQARGTWFFEATFPVVLTNWDGLIIAEGYAEAKGEWMTQNFVPFEATLDFESPYKTGDPDFMKRGTLILQRANPSGLPENDAALEYNVIFAAGNK